MLLGEAKAIPSNCTVEAQSACSTTREALCLANLTAMRLGSLRSQLGCGARFETNCRR